MSMLTNKRRQLEDKIRLWARQHNRTTRFERVECFDEIRFTYYVDDHCGKVFIKSSTDVSEVWLTIKHNLERRFTTNTDGLRATYIGIDEWNVYDPIKKVIFNPPATIVLWNDGTKTVVKCTDEEFDPEKGLAMAISKKLLGNKGNYYNEFKKWLPEEEESKKDEFTRIKMQFPTFNDFFNHINELKNKTSDLVSKDETWL